MGERRKGVYIKNYVYLQRGGIVVKETLPHTPKRRYN
jgi:hypothetical protein